MLKASAMAYAIFIFVIIGISCYSFVLLGSMSRLHNIILSSKRELVRTNEVAQSYYLKMAMSYTTTSTKDILDNGMLSQAKVMPWGVFKILTTTTYFKRDTIKRLAVIGQRYTTPVALYLANNGKPLHLAGKASISGDAFVPGGIIKVGYIGSNAFKKVNFKGGKINTSKIRIPKLNYFEMESVSNGVRINLDTLQTNVLHNPFYKETLVVTTTQKQLSRLSLKGNIKLIAKDSIYINGNCLLEDIIIEAPKIVLGQGFKGAAQLFAKEHVCLNKNATLLYPSSIYVKNTTDAKITVTLNENSKLIGGLVIEDEEYVGNTLRMLTIKKGAQVVGNVYCNASLDLKGEIIGSVFVDRFYLKTNSGIYENYIKGGQINALQLPKHFIGVTVFNSISSNANYEAIKYL